MVSKVSPVWERSLTKGGQNLSVDFNDFVDEVQISSLQHCSDQDEIGPTLGKSFDREEVPLVRSWRSSVGVTTCTGSGDHPSAAHFGYAVFEIVCDCEFVGEHIRQ